MSLAECTYTTIRKRWSGVRGIVVLRGRGRGVSRRWLTTAHYTTEDVDNLLLLLGW